MFRDVLSAIEGIAVRPTLALLIFVVLFVAMLIWVIRLSRDYIEKAKRIPLDEDPPEPDDAPGSSSEKSDGAENEKPHPQTGRSNQNNISNRSQE